MNEQISTFNMGALSVWHQLENKPDFVKAFKAISQLKKLYLKSDPYGRYFAHNIYLLAYNNMEEMKRSVLGGFTDSAAKAIFEDAVYGLGTSQGTLYRWVKAMNDGPTSITYKNILAHFKGGRAPGFTDETMNQIIGPTSLMYSLNFTFEFNCLFEFEYSGGLAANFEIMLNEQWAERRFTSNTNVTLWTISKENPLVSTIYELYKEFAETIPDSFGATTYAPEINYFLEVNMSLSAN